MSVPTVQFPPANRPFAIPTLEILNDAAIAAANDAIEHSQPILLSRAQMVKILVDRFDQIFAASVRAAAETGEAAWIRGAGRKPDLPDHMFVYVHFTGESREEAEAFRGGYGQSIDSVHNWAEVIEYRVKPLRAVLVP